MDSQPRQRRWLRRLLAVAAGLCLVIGFLLWLLTRSWFITMQVRPVLERNLGGAVEIRRAGYMGGGWFSFDEVVVRARTLDGPAAEILRVGHGEVQVSMWSLLSLDPELLDVRLQDVELRISEDVHESGSLNFMSLTPDWRKRPDTIAPPVRIENAVIEVGEHDGDQYTARGERHVVGELFASASRPGWLDVELNEIGPSGERLGDNGVLITGSWNPRTNAHHGEVLGVTIDERTRRMCPHVVRVWWDRMNLEGRVALATVDYNPDQPFRLEFMLQDLAMSLPLDLAEAWSRYRAGRIETVASRPRMFVDQGRFVLTPHSLELTDVVGAIGSASHDPEVARVPYRLSLELPTLPTLDWPRRETWMQEVLNTAPFELSLNIDDFSVGAAAESEQQPVAAHALELPHALARALERFQLSRWTLASSVQMSRAAPQQTSTGERVAAPILTRGSAKITNAEGAYEQFPYALTDIAASLRFETDHVTIESLTGRGAEDASVHLSGTITPLTGNPSVSLNIRADRVPLDHRFRAALPELHQGLFDALLHHPSHQSLVEHGLLTAPDDTNVERASTPGGVVDLDLTITRTEGVDQPALLTGAVNIHRLNLLYDRFPYPLTVTGGTVRIEPDRITIDPEGEAPGAPITAFGNGRGWISGEILVDQHADSTPAAPNLHVVINNDTVNDVLLAAVPADDTVDQHDDERRIPWRPGKSLSSGARFVQNMRLEGVLDYDGRILTNTEGALTYDFALTLSEGGAQPTQELADWLGLEGLVWPRDFQLGQIDARAKVTPDALVLESFDGSSGETQLAGTGRVAFAPGPREIALNVDFRSLELDEYLLNLVPGDSIDQVRAIWDQYQPAGRFSAALNYHTIGEDIRTREVRVFPDRVHLVLGDQPILIRHQAGHVRANRDSISFDGLEVEMERGGQRDGRIRVNGAYGLSDEESPLELRGTWRAGSFESPLIRHVLESIAPENAASTYSRMDASGIFDAEFVVQSGEADAPPSYRVAVHPASMAFRMEDASIALTFAAGAEVVLLPGRIEFNHVAGEHAGGSFAVDGELITADQLSADLNLDYTGRLMSRQVSAFLPSAVERVLESVNFTDGQSSRLNDGRLSLSRMDVGDDEFGWRVAFDGSIETADAGFDAGVPFRDFDGRFDLSVRFEPQRVPRVTVGVDLQRVRAKGRLLEDVKATVQLSPQGDAVLVPELRGSLYGGTIWATAHQGLGERDDYRVELGIVGTNLDHFMADAVFDPTNARANETTPPQPQYPQTRGQLFARLNLAGRVGEPSSRRGLGVAKAIDGRVASVPFVLQIMQIPQLSMPSSNVFDYAEIQFYVDGSRAPLERVLLESTSGGAAMMQLIGEGWLDLARMHIMLRFRSRGSVAVLRDIVGGFGDQVAGIEVSGPLDSPSARLVPLPGLNPPVNRQ